MKKIKKGIPRRSRRKYSCEIMPFRKNCTRKEKKKLMWEVKEDKLIKDQIIKGLGCQTKECETYSACYGEPC